MEPPNLYIGDPCICGSDRIYYAEEDGRPWSGHERVWFEKCPDCGCLFSISYPLEYYEGNADPIWTLITEH